MIKNVKRCRIYNLTDNPCLFPKLKCVMGGGGNTDISMHDLESECQVKYIYIALFELRTKLKVKCMISVFKLDPLFQGFRNKILPLFLLNTCIFYFQLTIMYDLYGRV